MTYIYCYVDPRNKEIRYVGATKDVELRLCRHVEKTLNSNRYQPKEAWIEEVMSVGMLPEVFILQSCEDSDASQLEAEWVKYLRGIGADLVNVKREMSESQKTAIGNALRGRIRPLGRVRMNLSKEERQRLSQHMKQVNLGRIQDPKKNHLRLLS